MGVTRIFELITWYESGPLLTWYWAVFDIFNILQAVAIFIIYVCKRDVVRALKNKMPKFIHRPKGEFPIKFRNSFEGSFNLIRVSYNFLRFQIVSASKMKTLGMKTHFLNIDPKVVQDNCKLYVVLNCT